MNDNETQKINDNAAGKPHETVIFIDKQQFKLESEEMTVAKLLELAGDDPKETTLALKRGNDLKKYDDITFVVSLENGMKFVVFHNGPTTVS
jgi:hypothetical protein